MVDYRYSFNIQLYKQDKRKQTSLFTHSFLMINLEVLFHIFTVVPKIRHCLHT
jgi:hypothetical protein